jgi:ferredoxin-NADP reductase
VSKQDTIVVSVASIKTETAVAPIFELRPANPGDSLPSFEAGAHVDIHLPNGLVRSYSLLNAQDERHRYVIAVNLDAKSRGGSRYLHESVRAGDLLNISVPRNNFRLHEKAEHTVLFAGGIGITPLWSMIQRLDAIGRTWTLYYCARSRQFAALAAELSLLKPRSGCAVHFHFDDEQGGALLDMGAIVNAESFGTHFYCCGPVPMLESFEQAAVRRPRPNVHVEYFSAKSAPDRVGGFEVVLAKSNRVLRVESGDTILDVLLAAGIDVPHSCCEGVCGSCLVTVLEGEPNHTDLVLTRDEQAANNQMLICCSGAKTDRLILDI